jgi:hypothetical protein
MVVGSSPFGRVAGSGLARAAMIRPGRAPFYHRQTRCQQYICRSGDQDLPEPQQSKLTER